MTFHYRIETKLPTLNEYILCERTNKFGASAIKKKFTNICSLYAKTLPLLEDKLYDFECVWVVDNNRTDSDNIFFAQKFIIDGLVKSGKLKSDGRRNVRDICHHITTGNKFSIDIYITEAVE